MTLLADIIGDIYPKLFSSSKAKSDDMLLFLVKLTTSKEPRLDDIIRRDNVFLFSKLYNDGMIYIDAELMNKIDQTSMDRLNEVESLNLF